MKHSNEGTSLEGTSLEGTSSGIHLSASPGIHLSASPDLANALADALEHFVGLMKRSVVF